MKKAYEIFTEVVRDGAYANLALKKGLKDADSRTAGRVTALVYSAIEHISYADYLIAAYAKGRLHGSIKNVLRLAVTELFFMDKPDHAVCSEAVELTREIGKGALTGVVNGILRNIVRDRAAGKLPPLPEEPAARLAIQYGMPRFMTEEYLSEYGEEFTESLLSARLHALTVRAQYPYTTAELEAELTALGLPFRRGRFDGDALILDEGADIASLPLFREGKMTVQSESAMLVCRACRVKDGMRVLDTCAAPGGKSCFLSALMHGIGRITALEFHPHRTELLRATAQRLGAKNILCLTADASKPLGEVLSSAGADTEYDVVLCDVPCSGLGGGSKPDALLNRTEADIEALSRLQLAILLNAAEHVAPGGALVYSTCTISKRENRDNVLCFLEERPDFAPEPLRDILGGSDPAEGEPFIQLFPNRDGTDGFFIARLTKKETKVE